MKKWFKEVAGKEFDPKTLFDKKRIRRGYQRSIGLYVRNTMPTYSLVPDLIIKQLEQHLLVTSYRFLLKC